MTQTSTGPGTHASPATGPILQVRGLGHSYVPVRFGHPPEIALITLRAVGPPPAATDSARAQQPNVDSLIQVVSNP